MGRTQRHNGETPLLHTAMHTIDKAFSENETRFRTLFDEKHLELPKGNGELVLVIDDEMSIRDITKTSLEAHGYNVVTAGDGTEALGIYAEKKAKIKVVLTDMMMPFMDGAATIRALRKMNPHAKIIAASGLASNEGSADGAKADVFLTKPYTAEKLLRALEKVLR